MSGGMYGADIEALRLLADKISEGGTSLDGVVSTVESAMVGPGEWDGPDAEGFRAEWGDTHAVRLRDTANLLRDVATKVRENAEAQDTTSNDYTGFAGATGTGSGHAGGGGGGGGGGSTGGGGDDGGNPLANPGADPTNPDNTHRGNQYTNESHGTYDENGNYTPTENDADGNPQSAVNHPAEKGDINHTLAEGETGGFVGYENGVEGSVGSEDGAHASGEAGVAAGAGYDASGEVSISENGLVAEGSAGVDVGASASASGQVGYGEHLGAEGSAEAFVGARADVNAGASIGPDGVGVSAGFDAFAGAEASANGSVTAAGVTADAGVTGYAGVGITGDVDASFGYDSVGVDLEFGAALGLGAGFDVSLEWSPADTVDAISDFGGDIVDGAGDAVGAVGDFFGL